jgi:hypothetical protein
MSSENLTLMKMCLRAFAVAMLATVALYKVEADVFEVNDSFSTELLPTSEIWNHMLIDLADPLSF